MNWKVTRKYEKGFHMQRLSEILGRELNQNR